MRHPFAALALAVAVATTACVPKAFPEDDLPVWEERPVIGTFNADIDDVWTAALTVFGEVAQLDVLDRNAGHIETGWVRDHSDYIYKTYGGTRVPEPTRWRMTVDIRRKSGKTEVEIVSQEQIEKDMISANLEFTGSIYKWIDVPSSTAKERQMLEQILVAIESQGPSSGGNNNNDDDYDYDYAQ